MIAKDQGGYDTVQAKAGIQVSVSIVADQSVVKAGAESVTCDDDLAVALYRKPVRRRERADRSRDFAGPAKGRIQSSVRVVAGDGKVSPVAVPESGDHNLAIALNCCAVGKRSITEARRDFATDAEARIKVASGEQTTGFE